MTGQISDSVIFQGEKYSLAEFEGDSLFDPAIYGLKPSVLSTACWRGFVCTYKVFRKRLKLCKLSIELESEEYETLFKALGIDFNANTDKHTRESELSDLAVDIGFTGTMLIGRDFRNDLYIHMGFQSASSYKDVWSLDFDNGELKAADDISLEMEEYRESYFQRLRSDGYPNDLMKWIEERFSRRIRRGDDRTPK